MEPEWSKLDFLKVSNSSSLLPMHVTFYETSGSEQTIRLARNRNSKEYLRQTLYSKPSNDSKELNFPAKYSQSCLDQFLTCLWKQNLSYGRNPQCTAVRFFYTVLTPCFPGNIGSPGYVTRGMYLQNTG
ncbi:hypothetical protein PVL29_004995 [Vitis rotundifolia]|uniref:Uncharacterized protein n=1 Tax=Vitis rotundifolia TaxID=103349 RepID=A0AA39E1R4_VITRO|nr:hypothetical protein PVL29_004995 [Vitis rotundifolia]